MTYRVIIRKLFLVFLWFIFTLVLLECILAFLSSFYSRRSKISELSDRRIYSILCLGDSFTYGFGVDLMSSYPKQLERMLNDSALNRKFKVYNLGAPGSNSSELLKYLELILAKYGRPDLVIILTGANDAWNFSDSNIYKALGFKKDRGLWGIKLTISKLRIFKMIKIISLNLRSKFSSSSMESFARIRKYENIDENILKNLLEYNLTEILTLAKENNFSVIFHNYPRGGPEALEDLVKRFLIPFVDNHAAFSKALEKTNFRDLFLYDNSHPSPLGCKIMASGIYKVISEQLLNQPSQ